MSREAALGLVEFSYSSVVELDQRPDDLMRLARQVWSKNARSGVTGVLKVHGRTIEQTIEGPRAVILPMTARILSDPRHSGILIRVFSVIAQRRYSDWTFEGISSGDDMARPVTGHAAFVVEPSASRSTGAVPDLRTEPARRQSRALRNLTFPPQRGL